MKKKETVKKEYGCGECAKCGSDDLAYDVVEIDAGYLFYPYTCNECGHEGEENYDIEWTHQT